MRKSDLPDRLAFREAYLGSADEWLNPGDSAIVDPDGKFLAGPVRQKETILYADVGGTDARGSPWQLDVAGHYGRPDLFQLAVDRRPRPVISSRDPEPAPRRAARKNPRP